MKTSLRHTLLNCRVIVFMNGDFLESVSLAAKYDRFLEVINWSISKRDKCELECGLHLLM